MLCGLSGGVDSIGGRDARATARSASGSCACSSTTACCARARPEEVARELARSAGSASCVVDARRRFLERLAGVADPGAQAQDHRRRVRRGVRGGGEEARADRVPRAGHALPRRDRERLGRLGRAGDQDPPQRRRAPGAHAPQAGRAAARPVQGRGAHARPRARAAGSPRRPPSVPGPGAGGAHPRARSSETDLEILRRADAIFIEELRRASWYRRTWQAFARAAAGAQRRA